MLLKYSEVGISVENGERRDQIHTSQVGTLRFLEAGRSGGFQMTHERVIPGGEVADLAEVVYAGDFR